MPCANPVARSCVRSVANAADAIAGLSSPQGSLIYSDFMSGLGGADPLLGYSLLGAQYQDGVLVGLQPACDDLTFAGLPGVRGMRTMWQVTNLNASNGLSGWSKIGVDVVSDIAFPTIGPGQHIATSLASVFTAGTSYTATLRLHVLTQIFVQVTFTSLTHGVTQYANIDMFNGVCTYSTGCAVYVRKIGDIVEIQYTATATTSGNGSVAIVFIPNGTSLRVPSYTGDGVSSVEFISLMLSATSYPVPYVPPGTTQTTTAHNGTSGIHYDMPQNGPIWNQLSTAKPLTLAARIVPGVGSADIPNSTTLNIRTCRSDPNRMLRIVKDSSGNCRVELHDGTNTAQSPIITWSRYQQLVVVGQVLTGGLQMRAGAKVGAGALSFGSAVTYAGTFGPDAVYSKLMLAHSNVYPIYTLKDWLADYQVSDSDILSAMGVAA